MKSSEISIKSNQSIVPQEENKEEVDEMVECNQSPSYYNKYLRRRFEI